MYDVMMLHFHKSERQNAFPLRLWTWHGYVLSPLIQHHTGSLGQESKLKTRNIKWYRLRRKMMGENPNKPQQLLRTNYWFYIGHRIQY